MRIDSRFLVEHFDYSRWATEKVLDAVAPLTTEELNRPLHNSFESVMATLVHIFGADRIWLSRFQNQPRLKLTDAGETFTLPELKNAWAAVHDRFAQWAAGMPQDKIDGLLAYRNLQGKRIELPQWQACLHVVNHATYHRGQVTTMLRQLGHSSVSTDLIFYYIEKAGAK